MSERLRVLVSPQARKNVIQKTIDVIGAGTSVVEKIEYPLKPIPKECSSIVVVGGDGTVSNVVASAMQRDEPITIFISPGGSQNGLYTALKDAKETASPSDVIAGKTFKKHNPGIVNGIPFNHISFWGDREVAMGRITEALRGKYMPRRLRGPLGSALGALKTSGSTSEEFLEAVVVSPYFGTYKFFPQQRLYSDMLSLVSVHNDTPKRLINKLYLAAFCLATGQKIPDTIASVKQDKSFTIHREEGFDTLDIDGDTLKISNTQNLYFERSQKGVPVAALVFEK